jgi:pimeloyl-ACP methyl ester carboxylesterase
LTSAAFLLASARDARAALPRVGLDGPPGMLVAIGSSHQLHVHCVGKGSPTVILESGLGGTSLEWFKVQSQLSAHTRTCSYDRAGYGWSDSGPGPRHVERLARELAMLLVYASVPPPYVLVGHSFGGLLVRMFASRNADEVDGIVLVDSTHERQFQRLAAAGVRTPTAPTSSTFVIANHWSVPDGLPAVLRGLAQRLARRPKAVRSLYGELSAMRLSARQVATIGRPADAPMVVLARGHRSAVAPPEARRLDDTWLELQRELAGRMPKGSLQVVSGSGHHIHLDRPGLVVTAIRALVDASRAKQRQAAGRRIPPRRREGGSARHPGNAKSTGDFSSVIARRMQGLLRSR